MRLRDQAKKVSRRKGDKSEEFKALNKNPYAGP